MAVDGGNGAITGRLTLNRTKGMMSVPGFLPVEATVDFEQVGDTVGTYAKGQMKTTSTMYVKLPSFTLVGIPLGGGDHKAANYSVAELENAFASQSGYTIALELSPKNA